MNKKNLPQRKYSWGIKTSVLMLALALVSLGGAAQAVQGEGTGNGTEPGSQSAQKMVDTNDNGIPDGQEDFDADGTINKDDSEYVRDYVNMQDADGDGIPNKDDEDYAAPQDGTGNQAGEGAGNQVGDGSRDGLALRQGEAQFQNEALYNRVRGRIILKPEDAGRAYYVNPLNGMMRSLGRPADAFSIMREEGLGVSDVDFEAWDGTAPENLAGKILLKVEDLGQAYYVNPDTLEMLFLNRPADAFDVMRDLGLGISNDDFESCFVAE